MALDATNDSVRVSNGVTDLAINPDGSINVSLEGATSNEYNEITSVPSGLAWNTVVSYVAPSYARLKMASATGTNIAEFEITLNGDVQGKRYTGFGALNAEFNFGGGLTLDPGDMVLLRVRHNRSTVGDFSANLTIQI